MARSYYFRRFSTTADLGLTVSAQSTEDLLRGAARGMFSVMLDMRTITFKKKAELIIFADPYQELPIIFLNELLFIFGSKYLVPLAFPDLLVDGDRIQAMVSWGVITAKTRYKGNEIKAVTYQLYCWEHSPNQLQQLRIVFDV